MPSHSPEWSVSDLNPRSPEGRIHHQRGELHDKILDAVQKGLETTGNAVGFGLEAGGLVIGTATRKAAEAAIHLGNGAMKGLWPNKKH